MVARQQQQSRRAPCFQQNVASYIPSVVTVRPAMITARALLFAVYLNPHHAGKRLLRCRSFLLRPSRHGVVYYDPVVANRLLPSPLPPEEEVGQAPKFKSTVGSNDHRRLLDFPVLVIGVDLVITPTRISPCVGFA